eukprot:997665-Rhodomonas_salina.1
MLRRAAAATYNCCNLLPSNTLALSSSLVTKADYLSNTLTFYSSLATRSNFMCHHSSLQSSFDCSSSLP